MSDRYALTLGEQSEIHVGCEVHGNGLAKEGFTVAELKRFQEEIGDQARLVMLSDALPAHLRQENEAAVLHIKNGVDWLMVMGDGYADWMLEEQRLVEYDKFYFDRRRQRKLRKVARHNAVFGESHIRHSDDYKQSTVIAYDEVPSFKWFREFLPDVFGEKARNLNSEGNHYYAEGKTGIGFHGDAERKIVICCSLGSPTGLHFYWRSPFSSEVAEGTAAFELSIEHGDIYVMSEKATGYDWKQRSKYRLVHAAGAQSFVKKRKCMS